MKSRGDALMSPGPVVLQARNVQFDWSETPLHWIQADPIASHVMNAINFLLPEGERWFCETYREALPLIRDEALQASVRGFIGQEAIHAESHQSALDGVLKRHGIDPEPVARGAEYVFRKALGPRPGGSARRRYRNLVVRIALIAAIENLTAMLGDWLLNARLEDFDADPVMLDLFRWHGAEEVEHRMVAHDVATYFRVSYIERAIALVVAYAGFVVIVRRAADHMFRSDPAMPRYGSLMRWILTFGAVRRGTLPSYRRIVWSGIRALHPRFTPAVMGNTAQAVAYLAQSPAARAAAQ